MDFVEQDITKNKGKVIVIMIPFKLIINVTTVSDTESLHRVKI